MSDALPADLDPSTLAVCLGRPARDPGAAVSPPLQLTSTFVGLGTIPAESGPPLPGYGRPDNETVRSLERVLAALEWQKPDDDCTALAFGSGMAAISAVICQLPAGARVVAPDSPYNTTRELLLDRAASGQIEVTWCDVADTDGVRQALADPRPADLLWLESPTNPLLAVADLPALCAAAREAGCLVAVDNTFATPLAQQPLTLGADVVVHSVTKYLAGHSDLVMGAVVTRDQRLAEKLGRHRRMHGAIAGPFEAWLALRGIRTLDVRLRRQWANAGELAGRLAAHPKVSRVRYPGLPEDPGHDLAARTMRGFGAMLAIEVRGDAAATDRVVAATRLWVPATSLGGVESLLERRRRILSEPDVVPENLIRLSAGIESVEDLWTDLDAALSHAG